jgi:DNA-binding PadR family transcriptional regulator
VPPVKPPALSLSEWIVLSLVCEGPTHGHAVTRLVRRDGELGQIWNVHKAVVYRSLDRLTDLRLIQEAGEELSSQGPVRMLVDATDAGRAAALAWQHRPVEHARDIRSELLVKLALVHRTGGDPGDLLAAQHARLAPVAAALHARLAGGDGFDRTLLQWRYANAAAALSFLESQLSAQP